MNEHLLIRESDEVPAADETVMRLTFFASDGTPRILWVSTHWGTSMHYNPELAALRIGEPPPDLVDGKEPQQWIGVQA